MKGLIIKDFLCTKSYLKTLMILAVVILSIGAFSGSFELTLPLLIILISMLAYVTFSYDQVSHWDVYARTLPVSLKQVVLSKYIVGLITISAATILTLFVLFIYSLFSNTAISPDVLLTIPIYISTALFLLTILFPAVYRYGVEKSRLIMMFGFFLPTLVISFFAQSGIVLPDISEQVITRIFTFSPCFIFVLYAISYFISVRIFSKKEL